MKIDGKHLGQKILEELKKQVSKLKTPPHVAIVLVGNDPASASYVNQKIKKAEEVGIQSSVYRLPSTVSEKKLLLYLNDLNHLSTIHGIIVQRPLPKHIDSKKVDELTSPEKDIDGFNSQTKFPMPLPLAVMEILKQVHIMSSRTSKTSVAISEIASDSPRNDSFLPWLKKQNIVVIGKGETGGGPIIQYLKSMNINPIVIDSKTTNSEQITKNADIIITTVGKQGLIHKSNIKPGVILIGVGMSKGTDGKLHGDYNENEIKDIASFYTPIPGGVGPVNVAMLLKNLTK